MGGYEFRKFADAATPTGLRSVQFSLAVSNALCFAQLIIINMTVTLPSARRCTLTTPEALRGLLKTAWGLPYAPLAYNRSLSPRATRHDTSLCVCLTVRRARSLAFSAHDNLNRRAVADAGTSAVG